MKLVEEKIKSEEIYKGKIIKVSKDLVKLPNGKETYREIVDHPGGVGIIPLEGNRVYLVKQYRYAFSQELLEIPAGKKEIGEDPFETAKRELKEEIGATAKRYVYLGEFYPTVGYCKEIIYLYAAFDLSFGDCNLDDDEFLNVVSMDLDECLKMIRNNEIKDAKTIIGLLKVGEVNAKEIDS